jgi:hypothetical protein
MNAWHNKCSFVCVTWVDDMTQVFLNIGPELNPFFLLLPDSDPALPPTELLEPLIAIPFCAFPCVRSVTFVIADMASCGW